MGGSGIELGGGSTGPQMLVSQPSLMMETGKIERWVSPLAPRRMVPEKTATVSQSKA